MNVQKNAFILFILLVSISSCKDNSAKKIDNTESNKQEASNATAKEPTQFSLTIRALVESDDLFEIFFIQENSASYTVNQMLSQEVKGSSQYQDVKFNMPSEYYPFNFRIDLGTNSQQNSIKIEECTLKYGTSKYVINGNQLHEYFVFNEGVEMLPDSITFRLKTFKEGNNDKYDPFLMGNQNLNEVLLKKL